MPSKVRYTLWQGEIHYRGTSVFQKIRGYADHFGVMLPPQQEGETKWQYTARIWEVLTPLLRPARLRARLVIVRERRGTPLKKSAYRTGLRMVRNEAPAWAVGQEVPAQAAQPPRAGRVAVEPMRYVRYHNERPR